MRAIDADAFAKFLKDTVKRQRYEAIKIDGSLTVADVIEAIISELDGTSLDGFKNAPTIEPELNWDEWCTDCKEYDQERHCCPRFNRVIRNALKDAQPEPHYCRECKWSRCHINVDKHGNTETYWHCHNWDGGTDEEGYCYEWERRTDDLQ